MFKHGLSLTGIPVRDGGAWESAAEHSLAPHAGSEAGEG